MRTSTTRVPSASTRRGTPGATSARAAARISFTESRSQILLEDVRAVQAAHVLPAHLGGLAHLLQRLRAPLGRGRVPLHDLVAALAVDLVRLDVDGEELHLVVREAVVLLERREVALVDAGYLRLQPYEQPGGGNVERRAR